MSDPYEKAPERQGMPGKTPGKAEGGEERRERPFPNAPGKTPGSAEGGPAVSTDEVPGERSPDPNRFDERG